MIANFRYDSDFRYHSENMAIVKFHYDCEIFAIIAKFSQSLRNFRYHCEIFAILANFSLCRSENPDPPALLPASIQPPFLHFPLDISSSRLDEITENSYELGINQHQYEAKLEMMAEVPKT